MATASFGDGTCKGWSRGRIFSFPALSASSLAIAILTYFALLSHPMKRRPSNSAATGVLLRNPHGVQVEVVVLTLCEPHDGLMPPAEAVAAVSAMAEGPDDPVAQKQFCRPRKDAIDDR